MKTFQPGQKVWCLIDAPDFSERTLKVNENGSLYLIDYSTQEGTFLFITPDGYGRPQNSYGLTASKVIFEVTPANREHLEALYRDANFEGQRINIMTTLLSKYRSVFCLVSNSPFDISKFNEDTPIQFEKIKMVTSLARANKVQTSEGEVFKYFKLISPYTQQPVETVKEYCSDLAKWAKIK